MFFLGILILEGIGSPIPPHATVKQCKAVRKVYSVQAGIKRGATSISVLNFNIQILISNRFRVGTASRFLDLPSLLSHHSDSMARWSISSLCQSFPSELQKRANRANQLVLFFLAGANFWKKHAKNC